VLLGMPSLNKVNLCIKHTSTSITKMKIKYAIINKNNFFKELCNIERDRERG
jgi:hypothetical protein